MISREKTLLLVEKTLEKIKKEAAEKKHQTIYDILEFKHFPAEKSLKIRSFQKENIEKCGKEKWKPCLETVLQTDFFRQFAVKKEGEIIRVMSEIKIPATNYNLIVNYIPVLNGYADSPARANYATLELLAQSIKRNINHFIAINSANSEISHEYLIIGDSNIPANKNLGLDEFISGECIVFDPTLYIICTPKEYFDHLQKKFPLFDQMLQLNTTFASQTNHSDAIRIIENGSHLNTEILKLGYDFKFFSSKACQARKEIISNPDKKSNSSAKPKQPSVLEQKKLLVESVTKHETEIKPYTKNFNLTIQSNKNLLKEFAECEQSLKELHDLQNTCFGKSLKILLDEKALASENTKKLKREFLKEYIAFKNSISLLTTVEPIEKAKVKLNKLEEVWKEMQSSEVLKKYNDQIANYNALNKQKTLGTPSTDISSTLRPTKDFSEKHGEEKAALQKLCEEYKNKKENFQQLYEDTNKIYKALYERDYKLPKSLKKAISTEDLMKEADTYVVPEQSLKKIEQCKEEISSLIKAFDKDISDFEKLKKQYEKKEKAKNSLSIAPHATTFPKKTENKNTSSSNAKAHRFHNR